MPTIFDVLRKTLAPRPTPAPVESQKPVVARTSVVGRVSAMWSGKKAEPDRFDGVVGRPTAWKVAEARLRADDIPGLPQSLDGIVASALALDKYVLSVMTDPNWRQRSSSKMYGHFAAQFTFMRQQLATLKDSPEAEAVDARLAAAQGAGTISYHDAIALSVDYIYIIDPVPESTKTMDTLRNEALKPSPLIMFPIPTATMLYIPERALNTLWASGVRLAELPLYSKRDGDFDFRPRGFGRHDLGHRDLDVLKLGADYYYDYYLSPPSNPTNLDDPASRRGLLARRARLLRRFRQSQFHVSDKVATAMEGAFFEVVRESGIEGAQYRRMHFNNERYREQFLNENRPGWGTPREAALEGMRRVAEFFRDAPDELL